MKSSWNWLEEMLSAQPGHISCSLRNLRTGESFGWNADEPHPSASVIKIYLMAYLYRCFQEGFLSPEQRVPMEKSLLSSSSGILHFLRDVPELSVRDLIELMIIVSDNSATNLLIDLAGMEKVNAWLRDDLHLAQTRLCRKMMDLEAIARGRQNITTAGETADFLSAVWRGELVSPAASAEMLSILKHQQFQHMIPDRLTPILGEGVIGNKTGGLDGVVHDAAIIDTEDYPFVLCFFGSETDVPSFRRLMQDASLRVFRQIQGQ